MGAAGSVQKKRALLLTKQGGEGLSFTGVVGGKVKEKAITIISGGKKKGFCSQDRKKKGRPILHGSVLEEGRKVNNSNVRRTSLRPEKEGERGVLLRKRKEVILQREKSGVAGGGEKRKNRGGKGRVKIPCRRKETPFNLGKKARGLTEG